MLQASAAICKEKAIKQLYVHVVPSNEAAHDLYIDGCGFQVEVKENANEAYIRDRERRFLLRRDVIWVDVDNDIGFVLFYEEDGSLSCMCELRS